MRLFPIYTWTKGIRNFDHRRRKFSNQPWAQGVILLSCVVVAMLLANLPFTKELYHSILETKFSLFLKTPGGKDILFPKGMTIESFINDILMTIFFFTVGLEIRREMKNGELSSVKKALMPVIAAFGGVLAPALIFTLVNHGTAASSGWGIPTATDIAFAVGILSILGDKVPVSLKVFLTALAIADDLIAILVVAIFYGGSINFGLLGLAIALIVLIVIMNKLGEKRGWYYFVPAMVIWALFYYAGIHSTMSGVVMAFLVPMAPRYNEAYYHRKRVQYIQRLNDYNGIATTSGEFPNGPQRHCLRRMATISEGAIPMSYRLEHRMTPWVNFLIMPLFALANAGVEIPDLSYFNVFHIDPALGGVGMGIFLGLLVGKPLGISLASFIAVKCKAGEMPANASWKMLIAVACLGGIGFTMSIFVDTLSFGDQTPEVMARLRDMGKVAVLMGSLSAGILGSLLINIIHKLSS
ncbi:MAG: Na+/H+ antiporter NhaA [Bacteroidales bacterium]|nr:Na+/H+ antiporter NhaA [Bacteroidales bacterium]MBP3270552.1 Na+/H+ antiporter NhaA [Bacteroidales bacterium]